MTTELSRSAIAAAALSSQMAELLVDVEVSCQRYGCRPNCELAQVARRVAVSASLLAVDWATEAGAREAAA